MPHLITLSLPRHRSPVRTSTWPIVKKPIWSSYSFLFRMYVPVNLVNSNTSHLIIIPLPLHPSPDRTWTLSIVWKPLIWSSSSCVFSSYVNLVSLNTVSSDLPLPLHSSPESTGNWSIVWIPLTWSSNHFLLVSPGCTWTWSIVRIPLIWSSDPSSPESTLTWAIVWNLSSDQPIPSPSSVSRSYVQLGQLFEYLIWFILSLPFHPFTGCRWT